MEPELELVEPELELVEPELELVELPPEELVPPLEDPLLLDELLPVPSESSPPQPTMQVDVAETMVRTLGMTNRRRVCGMMARQRMRLPGPSQQQRLGSFQI